MGVDLVAQLSRKNGANFPLAAAEDILGAFATVANTTARDAIPTAILRVGAIVRISNTSAYYEWNGSAWVSLSFGGGTSAIDWKESVRVATTANITLSGTQTIDGVAVVAGNRVLVKNQSTASQNGIYVCGAGAWTRAGDADVSAEVTAGMGAVVSEGTANGGNLFLLTTPDPITLGTTALTFSALSSGSSLPTGSAVGQTLTWNGSAFAAGALNLADNDARTGALPVANGGTGLTSLGTALYVLRVNAAGTALEYAAASGGGGSGDVVGPASSVTTRIATFSGTTGKLLADGGQTIAQVVAAGAAAAPQGDLKANGTVPLSADWAVGNKALTGVKSVGLNSQIDDGNSGSADTIDFSAGSLHKSTLTAATVTLTLTPPAAPGHFQLKVIQDATGKRKVTWAASSGTITWITNGGSPPRLRTNAAAVDWINGYFDGTDMFLASDSPGPGPIVGTDLGDASATINISQGNHRAMPRSTTTTARTISLDTSGSPKVDEVLEVVVFAQGHNVVFHDNGAGVDTYTVAAGEAFAVHHKWDSVGWRKAGLFRMATT